MRGTQVSRLEQQEFHAVGICHIHLASEGFHISLFHRVWILPKFPDYPTGNSKGLHLLCKLLKKQADATRDLEKY
jgi:hypothetical protein